jgi:hypothetical protein
MRLRWRDSILTPQVMNRATTVWARRHQAAWLVVWPRPKAKRRNLFEDFLALVCHVLGKVSRSVAELKAPKCVHRSEQDVAQLTLRHLDFLGKAGTATGSHSMGPCHRPNNLGTPLHLRAIRLPVRRLGLWCRWLCRGCQSSAAATSAPRCPAHRHARQTVRASLSCVLTL